MAKYRKKPVVIEAIRVGEAIVAAGIDWGELPQWLRDAYDRGDVIFMPRRVSIRTLEGALHAEKDDWIICGVKGELYPCKPDIFEMTYEPVEEASSKT